MRQRDRSSSPRFRLHDISRAIGRRDFLRGGLAAGVALGLPPLLAACGSDDETPAPPSEGTEQRTLFFNLSHLPAAGQTHYLFAAGARHALVPVRLAPGVLAQARLTNEFLRAVPDANITHHAVGIVLPTDTVSICYQYADLDTHQGTWSMTGVFFNIPPQAAQSAYAHARLRTPAGPLPRSAKRALYGVRAAASEADLREERALVDTSDYAAAMVGAHPDLMSLDPGSAHSVHSNYIDASIDTYLLSVSLQTPAYGPAMPAPASGGKNPTGWGTLVPVTGDDGQPLVNTLGTNKGRIQYQPAFHPDIAAAAASASSALVPALKNDTTFGTDVTGRAPVSGVGGAVDPDPTLAGSLWFRHDGTANVTGVSAAAGAATPPTLVLKNGTPGILLQPSATCSINPDNSVQVSLSLLNWGLRFLGVYVQFLRDDTDPPTVVALKDIPDYVNDKIIPGHTKDMDTDHEMFLGLIGPVFTILGIPAAPGFLLPGFRMPASPVDHVRVLSSGLAFTGPNLLPGTVLPGAIMTGIFNYGLTAFMAVAGAAGTFSAFMKESVVPFVQAIAPQIIAFISAELKKSDQDLVDLLLSPAYWETQGIIFAKMLVSKLVGAAVAKFVAVLTADLTEAVVQDSIPVAGWVMLGISLAVGAINLAETTAELALSPWTYVDDLTFTHDLSVSLLPDPKDANFPAQADHYTVTAMFDDGTPRVTTLAMPGGLQSTLPPVVFTGVPLGGQVNVSVAFHRAGDATSVDTLLGKGSTGLVPNTLNPLAPLTIEELQFPIDATTVYQHQRKTVIDAGGTHRWQTLPAPTANLSNSVCGGPGTLCAWNGITVRQATSSPARAGYIGYAWRGQSTDPSVGAACLGGGTGQLDTVANLDTTDASLGYATTICGLQPGALVTYNLLSHGSANYFLDAEDPNAPMIRQVTLEPAPVIDARAGMAWGVLNLRSDALLLHPAGHVISLNTVAHKVETHRLPTAPLADGAARSQLRAQLRGGQGTRPGLLTAPLHAAVAADGAVLVLEAGDAATKTPSRLQAFNLSMNPVRFFAKQPEPYFLMLAATPNDQGWAYLDLAVEFTGFIYVLSYHTVTFQYRLDIYHPTQTGALPISTTTGINAARIAIDFWRNVYALNYEVLALPKPGLAEPSVSVWVPSGSCVGVNCVPG